MQDMIGRRVNSGDLVLHQMKYALFISETKLLLYHKTESYESRIYHEIYLIENPTTRELEIKKKLLNEYGKQTRSKLAENRTKADAKALVKKNSKRGDVVGFDSEYRLYLYLGKAKVIYTDDVEEVVGHTYVPISGKEAYKYEAVKNEIKNLNGLNYNLDNLQDAIKFIGVLDINCNGILVYKNKTSKATSLVTHYNLIGDTMTVPTRRYLGYNKVQEGKIRVELL